MGPEILITPAASTTVQHVYIALHKHNTLQPGHQTRLGAGPSGMMNGLVGKRDLFTFGPMDLAPFTTKGLN
jgi:hypothetical protein